MISHLAGLGLENSQVLRFTRHDGLDPLTDIGRLERLTIVSPEQVVAAKAGLGSQVPPELSCVVDLDDDGRLAGAENLQGLLGVERVEVFEMELIGSDSGGIELSGCLVDHAPGGAPADERYMAPDNWDCSRIIFIPIVDPSRLGFVTAGIEISCVCKNSLRFFPL